VIGTVSTAEKAALAEAHGCHHTILYLQMDFVPVKLELTKGLGVDLALDAVGKTTLPGSLKVLEARGQFVVYGAASGLADVVPPNGLQLRSPNVSGGDLFGSVANREERLSGDQAVSNAAKQGWLYLGSHAVLALARAAQGHRLLEERHSTGKIVLRGSCCGHERATRWRPLSSVCSRGLTHT